jgi:hypothetical protein
MSPVLENYSRQLEMKLLGFVGPSSEGIISNRPFNTCVAGANEGEEKERPKRVELAMKRVKGE